MLLGARDEGDARTILRHLDFFRGIGWAGMTDHAVGTATGFWVDILGRGNNRNNRGFHNSSSISEIGFFIKKRGLFLYT